MFLTRSVPALGALVLLFSNSTLVGNATQAGEVPEVRFDLPAHLVARELHEPGSHASSRLVEVVAPVSVRVLRGGVHKVKEVTIEIDAGCESSSSVSLAVADFAPQTTLASDVADPIQVTTTNESTRSFEASLGGESPLPLGDVVAQVTPSLSGGKTDRTAETITKAKLAPKLPLVVSGTLNGGRGVFFQLRPSSQTTLEGQHQLSVVFRVPAEWNASQLQVRCWARGERQILWFDQPQTWGTAVRTVQVALPTKLSATPHLVAKQPVGEWKAPQANAEVVEQQQDDK